MSGLFLYTLYAGYLGWQWRRVRTLQDEINELKKQVRPVAVSPDGNPTPAEPPSPVEAKIEQLTEERKALIKGSYRDKHFNAGSILLGFGVFESVFGGINTWFRTGKLFPGPHLFAGAAITVLWAAAAALVPPMQKGNESARNLHIALNTLNIFNWVHRKLSYKGGGLEENANKIVVCENNIDSNNVFDQLFSGGILTIGTFGYNPLNEPNEENNSSFSSFFKDEVEKDEENTEENETASEKEEEEEEENNEEEVKNPFVLAAFEHDYKGLIMEGIINNNNHNKEIRYCDYVMMEKKQRITLADLFSAADSHANDKKPTKNNNNNNNNNVIKKAKCTKKHAGHSKLITREARPIRKLQKMVRRVLRKKVHPDMSSPSYKVPVKKCEMFDDHASLLPTNRGSIFE
ncbi:rhomboid-related intramembrane serine proteasefamily protein [Striga asiatica]|uniref:Rhomboid-related intramembrane serine proteasefamily protein n=1 Tax=Striga asiatica TaxID=4170 RepID=A0A5A7R2B4_STRAF|nr:rhomboid-related intramembrane serine proteasefamily protein [Striga asiatica]